MFDFSMFKENLQYTFSLNFNILFATLYEFNQDHTGCYWSFLENFVICLIVGVLSLKSLISPFSLLLTYVCKQILLRKTLVDTLDAASI